MWRSQHTNIVTCTVLDDVGKAGACAWLLVERRAASIARGVAITLAISLDANLELDRLSAYLALVQSTLDTCVLVLSSQSSIGPADHAQRALAARSPRR